MNEEAQRIAIAEACGWENCEAELATVKAINELSKSGKIEVYDTGDAWISC